MQAGTYSQIKTLVPISADGINFPAGTLGAVVEAYSEPEGYAVDLAIPDSKLVGGFRYHNVILSPEQFAVIENIYQKDYSLEKIIEEEDRGLAKLMEEVDDDEVLSKSEALAYLQSLKKDGLDS